MSKIYITGDTHGEIDINKLNRINFPDGQNLTKDDYVIICGDFGLVWGKTQEKTSKYWQKWLNNKPWTTLFVCGNHEDFDLLNSYPVTSWHGGKVHQISDSIYHLMRGEIYDIDGLSFLAFGGGFSHDRYWRTEHISWWQDELPTRDEVDNLLINLENHQNKVDVVITHDVPAIIRDFLSYDKSDMSPYDAKYVDINNVLDHIYKTVNFKTWFAGHYHINTDIDNFHLLYDNIIELTPKYLEK